MTYEDRGAPALDYFPCRYGASRSVFRGPRQRLDGDYIAFLGGTETYGRFIPRPYPALVEDRLGLPCVNFGWVNAGPEAFLGDETVLAAAHDARAVVLQVPGAQNLTNRYYTVHPRRNDRFLRSSALMRKVFPETDFTEFHFTRHMLNALSAQGDRYSILVAELQFAWVARMNALLSRIGRPVVLLWFAPRPPGGAGGAERHGDPLFVTTDMITALQPRPLALVDATPSAAALEAGTRGMVFAELEAPAAKEGLGPAAHAEAAEKLAAHLADLLVLGT